MGGQGEPWFRNRALAFVLQLSRVAGVAPLVFTESGPRVSTALSIYGKLLITVISGLTIWLSVSQGVQSTEKKDDLYKAKTTQILIQWLSYSTMTTNIISVSLAAGRMKSLIEIAKRVEIVKTKFELPSGEVKNKEKNVVVLYLVTFILFFTVESYFLALYIQLNIEFIIMRVTQLMRCLMMSITLIQLILTCRYIASLFPGYNNRLRQLLKAIDDKKPTDLIAFRFGTKSHIQTPRVYVSPGSLNTIVDRIGLFPSTIQHSHDTAESMRTTLRHLNAVYMEICALVDIMNHHHNAITMLLMLIVYTNCLIATLYHVVNKFISPPLPILLVLEAYWLMHHLTYIFLILDCGHRIIYETIEIKRTVSKLIGKVVFLKAECVDELNKLFVKLTLMEPTLSPLNVYTLSRGLVISIMGAAATYSVIVVQFRSSEI